MAASFSPSPSVGGTNPGGVWRGILRVDQVLANPLAGSGGVIRPCHDACRGAERPVAGLSQDGAERAPTSPAPEPAGAQAQRAPEPAGAVAAGARPRAVAAGPQTPQTPASARPPGAPAHPGPRGLGPRPRRQPPAAQPPAPAPRAHPRASPTPPQPPEFPQVRLPFASDWRRPPYHGRCLQSLDVAPGPEPGPRRSPPKPVVDCSLPTVPVAALPAARLAGVPACT